MRLIRPGACPTPRRRIARGRYAAAAYRPRAMRRRGVGHAPGRINLIGEHTDYNDGLVLPVAIDRTVAVAAAPGDGRCLRVLALDYNERDEFTLDDIACIRNGGWRSYVRGVFWALQDAGCEIPGADLAITGDVPQGAGLSSSAALEVAVAGALTALSGR